MNLKSIFNLAVSTMALHIVLVGFATAGTSPPVEGGVLPPIYLEVPQSEVHQQYLGISGGETFMIPQIKADVVLIEIFSMY